MTDSFIHRYLAIAKAMRVLEEDNGGSLLEFYQAGPPLETIINNKFAAVSRDFSESELSEIESFLSGLSPEHLDIIVTGAEDDILRVHAPANVNRFFDLSFEADFRRRRPNARLRR